MRVRRPLKEIDKEFGDNCFLLYLCKKQLWVINYLLFSYPLCCSYKLKNTGNKPIVINKIETGSSVGCGVFLSETCDGICDF